MAIKMVKSYIEEVKLLSDLDYKILLSLDDIWNVGKIKDIITEVYNKLKEVINDDEDFKCKVYFKPKSYDNGKVTFRPIHTAGLIDQIAMVAMMQVLMFDIDNDNKLMLSEMSRLIPSNFYGSMISTDAISLYKPWSEQYSMYTSKANELMNRYIESEEYTHEVTLDLKRFFPSINPQVAYTYLVGKLPQSLTKNKEDKKIAQKIIRKLLRIKRTTMNEQEIEWYGSKDEYVNGLPQGLPHTYYFANLIMCEIQSIYMKHIQGEMLFYVDDSIIYTKKSCNNSVPTEMTDKDWLRSVIVGINTDIQKFETEMKTLYKKNALKYKEHSHEYHIEVHQVDGKSDVFLLKDAQENSGERFLRGLCRETSKFSFDMYAASSDEDTETLTNKTKGILDAIRNEIAFRRDKLQRDKQNKKNNQNIELNKKNDDNEIENDLWLRKLYRYKKFFSYRYILLLAKTPKCLGKKFASLEKWLNNMKLDELARLAKLSKAQKGNITSQVISWNGKDISEVEAYLDLYDKGIIGTVISFIYNHYCGAEMDDKLICDLDTCVKRMEKLLYNNQIENAYLSKVIKHDKARLLVSNEASHSLYSYVKEYYSSSIRNNQQLRDEKFIRDIVPRFGKKDALKDFFGILGLDLLWKWSSIARASNDDLCRELLLAIFTYISGFTTDEKYRYAKTNGTAIRYCELRTIAHLCSRQFMLNEFIQVLPMYFDKEYRVAIEYSLLHVIGLFVRYVGEPAKVDDLILVHKYCVDTWKNGSKHLHFYTLHNQEHAVALIHQTISIILKISYFQIKRIDFYVLFCACYLHDISMVTLPDYSKFYSAELEQSDFICTEFMNEMQKEKYPSQKTLKENLLESYRQIERYFEQEIRSTHAKKSADEIRSFPELGFLSDSIRDCIARISEAHCDDVAEVYYAKSNGQDEKINEKLIAILLRLADVLDISRYRISQLILDHNLKNMDRASRFHWISHLLTDEHTIISEYLPDGKLSKSHLEEKRIKEKIVLYVDVLLQQTTNIITEKPCKNVSCSTIQKKDGKVEITLICKQNGNCSNNKDQCNFLCKWFSKKNEYLYQEFAALKNYLNTLPNNYFSSDVQIVLRVVGDAKLSGEHFDYLKDYLEKK